jgi:hypothetical protein
MLATLASIYFAAFAVLAILGALAYAHSAVVDSWAPAVSGRQPIAAEGRAYRTALRLSGPVWRAVHTVGIGAPLATIVHRAALACARYCYGCAPDPAYRPARFVGLAPVAPGTVGPWTALGLLVRWHLRSAAGRVTAATGILRARLSMAGSIVAGERGAVSWLAVKAPAGLDSGARATLRRWNARYWEGCEVLTPATVTGSTQGRALLAAGHVVTVADGTVWPSQAVQDWLDETW